MHIALPSLKTDNTFIYIPRHNPIGDILSLFKLSGASKTADSFTQQQLSGFIAQQKSESYNFYSTGISKEKLEASARAMASAYESAKSSNSPDVKNAALGFISSWAEWASQAAKKLNINVPAIATLKISGSGKEYETALSSGRNYFAVLSASLNQKTGIMALKENGVATLASALDDMALGRNSKFNFYQYKLTSDNAKIFSQVLSNLNIQRVEQMAAEKYANIPGDAQIVLFEKQPFSYNQPYAFKVEVNEFAAKSASQPASSDVELASIIPYPTNMATNTEVKVTQGEYSINDYKKFADKAGDKLVSTETITVNKRITFDMPLAFKNNPDSEEAFRTIHANMCASFLDFAEQLGVGTELPFEKFLKNTPEFRDMVQSMINRKSLKITGSASSEYCNNIDDAEKNLQTARTRAEMVFTWLNSTINAINKENQKEGKSTIILPVTYKPENISQTIALWWEISDGDINKIRKDTKKYALLNEYINSPAYTSEKIKKQRVDTFGLIYNKAMENKQDAVELWKNLTSGKSPAIEPIFENGKLVDVTIKNANALNQASSLKAAIASQSKFRSQDKTTLLERAFSINNSRGAYATMSLPGTLSIEIDKKNSSLDVDKQYQVSLTVKQTVKLNTDGAEKELITPYTGNVPFVRLFSRTSDLKTNPEAHPTSVAFDKKEGNLSKYIAIFPLKELKVPEGESRTFYGTVVAYATEKTDPQVYAMETPTLNSGLVRMSMEATKKVLPKMAPRPLPVPFTFPKEPVYIKQPESKTTTVVVNTGTGLITSDIADVLGPGTGNMAKQLALTVSTAGKILDKSAQQAYLNKTIPAIWATINSSDYNKDFDYLKNWGAQLQNPSDLKQFFDFIQQGKWSDAQALVKPDSELYNALFVNTIIDTSTSQNFERISQRYSGDMASFSTPLKTWNNLLGNPKGILFAGAYGSSANRQLLVKTIASGQSPQLVLDMSAKIQETGADLVYVVVPKALSVGLGLGYRAMQNYAKLNDEDRVKLTSTQAYNINANLGKVFELGAKWALQTSGAGMMEISPSSSPKAEWFGVVSLGLEKRGDKFEPYVRGVVPYSFSTGKFSPQAEVGANIKLFDVGKGDGSVWTNIGYQHDFGNLDKIGAFTMGVGFRFNKNKKPVGTRIDYRHADNFGL